MSRPVRLTIAATHPIQYQVPWFQALARRPELDLSVLYVDLPDAEQQGRGFGRAFEWDIPLLEGYRWRRVERLAGRGGFEGFFAARIRRPVAELRAMKPEVLLLTGWQSWPLWQLLWAGRRLGMPCLVRGESNGLQPRSGRVRLLHRLLLRQYAGFLTIGQANRRFYEGYGIPAERLFACPYFVDNRRFAAQAEVLADQRSALRAAWSIPEPATCLLFAGKFQTKKRPLDLLEALRLALSKQLLSKQPECPLHLLMVGTGELLDEARAFAVRHRLPVSFAGFLNQTEIARAYVAADGLVLPSDYGETWGLVVNEAMACGLPAVVSDRVGCGPDLIAPGETGEVVPFGDVRALADTLLRLAADRDRLRRMGERARARVMTGYSVERAVEGTLAAVRYVTGQT